MPVAAGGAVHHRVLRLHRSAVHGRRCHDDLFVRRGVQLTLRALLPAAVRRGAARVLDGGPRRPRRRPVRHALATIPGLLEEVTGEEVASLVFKRFAALELTGVFLVFAARGVPAIGEAEDLAAEDVGSCSWSESRSSRRALATASSLSTRDN